MKKELIYRDLARYYDLMYKWKDYKKESEEVAKLIKQYKKSKGDELLEVACGSGAHLEHLHTKFKCSGMDINKGILSIAKKKLKNVRFYNGNMINFNLEKKFDIITCLFSSIGYVKTYQNLEKTINNFARHLKDGGVLIVEPWFNKNNYRIGMPHLNTYKDKDIVIARVHISEAKGSISIMDMNYLIAEKNKKVKHFVERHEMGMFENNKLLKIMRSVGIDPKILKNKKLTDRDRGLIIGVKK